jgi:peptidoglycan/xylan/chitin deacetylase (PgdA/CDA1 family)
MTRLRAALCRLFVATLMLGVLPVVGIGAPAPASAVTGCHSVPYGVRTTAPGTGKTVALTFDDGPGRDTRRILAILASAHVTATFFNLGVNEARDPAAVRAERAAGAALGGHTWDHKSLPTLDAAGQASEIDRERAQQAAITGAYPCLFRPPYGNRDSTTLTLAQQRGMQVWNWSVDTEDWKAGGSGDAYWVDRIGSRAKAGASQAHPVILMHNQPVGNPATVAALPGIISYYRARGYRFVDLYGRTGLPAPYIRGIAPTSGRTSGGTRVTVVGTGFTQVTAVRFGSIRGLSVHVVSATKLLVTSPAHAAAVLGVQVVSAHGGSAARTVDHFTYVARPAVSAIGPTSGPTAGGTRVTVVGHNFQHVTAVHFGTTAGGSVHVASSTRLYVTAPARGAGVVGVQVFTSYGTSISHTVDHFHYVAPPVLGGVAPSEGPVAGGTLITLTGTGLANITAVMFGGVPATDLVVNSPTELTVRTPPHLTGVVHVQVSGAYGSSAAVDADQFTFS